MKKYVAIIVCLVVCQATFSQKNVNQLFKEFSKVQSVNTVNIGKITMSFANLFTDTMGVDGIEVFEFDNCTQDLKDHFAASVKQLKDSKYETMITSNDDNGRTKVLVRFEDEFIHEMVVVTTGSNNALIRIKGKIKPSDIERIMKKHSNG